MDTEQVIKELYSRGSSWVNITEDYYPNEDPNPKFNYVWNNYGFRSLYYEDYHLDDDNDIWCFGCSVTSGIGVAVEQTWPYLIQQNISRNVKNFGVGGGGEMTCHRLLFNWLKYSKHKPKQIFVLGFFPGRKEVYDKDLNEYVKVNVHDINYKVETSSQILNENTRLLQDICDTKNLHYINVEESYKNAFQNNMKDFGRDKMHPGVKYHKFIANEFSKHL
jgi:hypothetical protein